MTVTEVASSGRFTIVGLLPNTFSKSFARSCTATAMGAGSSGPNKIVTEEFTATEGPELFCARLTPAKARTLTASSKIVFARFENLISPPARRTVHDNCRAEDD